MPFFVKAPDLFIHLKSVCGLLGLKMEASESVGYLAIGEIVS